MAVQVLAAIEKFGKVNITKMCKGSAWLMRFESGSGGSNGAIMSMTIMAPIPGIILGLQGLDLTIIGTRSEQRDRF